MNVTGIVNLIIEEWAYRVNDGMPNPQNPSHLKELSIVLSEMGLSHIKEELVQNLITEKGKTPQPVKEEEKSFSNPILNKKVSYKDKEGNQKDGIVGNLLRQPEGTPARDAAEKVLPPEGSPERDALNQELGGEGGKKGEEEPKSGEDKQAAEKEKQQQAQAMFDPKVDPAMAARLDKEKETQAKLAADAEKDKEAEKPKEEPKKKDGFEPIPAQDVKNEIPEADPDTFGAPSDIPDGIGKEELKKFNTDISKVQQIVADAKAKGEKAPDINLCDITVPGTNLYCDDNLGIPRDQMPQFKGKPVPGSKAEKMPLNKDGEVDTEPVFREMLKEKGITTTQTEVPADKLKATQSELGGDKVVGMMGALEKDPNHPGITGPIYVSRDGFVIDGHHRWAAIAAYNAKYPDKQIPMKCEVVDMDIKDAIPMCNKFAEDIGIAPKKQGETTGTAGEQQPSEPAKREPANDDPESKAQKFKGKKSGEEIQTMEMEGGGFVYGTKHGNTAMVDDILDDVKSKIPKERWKDVVFVGEGGATNDAGELEFNDEMKYAAPKFKEMGAGVDTWDGDDMDVHNDQSKLYQKQKEKTGFNDSQVKAGNWASMIGQGEGTDTMSPNDFLDDDGKQFLQDAAKEAGLPPIENWDNPTGESPSEENPKGSGDKGTLYRLAFPEDNGDKGTKINDIQVAFNEIRDENLIEKNKELTAQGKIPITIAGESHVELVDKMSKKSKDTKQPKEKPEDTKDDKEDIKKEKPGQEATSSSGNKIYSVGGGYYSDKPNGPAKYVRTEWVVDLAFSDIITEDVFALFEKTITATLSNGKQIKVQELPPNDVKKATQKAKAAAASYKEPEQKPEAPKSETPPTDKKVAPPTRKEEPAEPGNPKGEYKPDPKLKPKVDDKGNVEGTDIPAQNEENPNPKFVNKVSTKLDDFYKDVLDEEERAQKAVIEKMKAEGKLPADFKEVHPLPFGFKHPALKDNPELQKEFSAAVKDENKPPHWDLCKVSIPGTNKFCDENIGIPRDKMPQLGGKPKPGSEGEAKAKRIADQNVRKKMGLPNDGEIPADKKQEYDDLYAKENTQHVNVEKEFEDYLKSEGINVSDPVEVPASSLKATQSELVGEQIVGMVNSLEQDPNNPFITAPIMVTRDGYVIDGHHRWATIQAYNMKHTPPNGDKEPIKMKVRIVDEDIETHIPRANAFAEKMGIETMSGKGKKKDEPKPATSTKPSTLSRIKEKLKNWNKKEKEYFNMGYHKPGSEARKSISERLRDKASGAWKAVKDGFKHEVKEFKTAGVAVGKLFSEAGGWNSLSHHEKDAIKSVGTKIVTTALFGAAMGGLSYGAVGFAKHVAIEFVPHVIAETFLKGAGRAALFADAEGEAEMDAQFIKFTEMIADGLENMKISPEQMEEMIDSYNKKKEKDTMKKEISIIDGIILEILNENPIKKADDVLNQTVKNPETGKDIKVASALKYKGSKNKGQIQAYQSAVGLLKKAGVSNSELGATEKKPKEIPGQGLGFRKTKEKDLEPTAKATKPTKGSRIIGGKDKTLSKVDTLKSKEFLQKQQPDDAKFAEKNKKFQIGPPPAPYKLPKELYANAKVPPRHLKALERMMNTRATTETAKWSHFSDLPGGAGQISAQAGELMTMISTTLDDKQAAALFNSLLEHEKQQIAANPKLKVEGSRVVGTSWIKAAVNNRRAIRNRLAKEYPGATIEAGSWDTQGEVEAMGLADYKKNKGFSTDAYFKIKTKDGQEILDEVSLKKSTAVNFLNSGTGKLFEWDPNIPDDINPNVYQKNQRKALGDFGKANIKKLQNAVANDPEFQAIVKSKKIDLVTAVAKLQAGKGSRDINKVVLSAITTLAKKGDKGAVKYLQNVQDVHKAHQKAVISSLGSNPKLKQGMLGAIREEFPLKAVGEGEESMAIGPNSLDRAVLQNIFQTSNFEEIKQGLFAVTNEEPPYLAYKAGKKGRVIPIATIVAREDGVGYGGQIKFEMQLDKRFAKILEAANKNIYG